MWLFSLIILNQLQSLNDILGEAETTVRKSAEFCEPYWIIGLLCMYYRVRLDTP